MAAEPDAVARMALSAARAFDRWLSSRSTTHEEYRAKFVDPAQLSTILVVELDGAVIGDPMLAVEDASARSDIQDRDFDFVNAFSSLKSAIL